MRMIARFMKQDDGVFCSHLDLQTMFIRAFKRGKIPVKYSKGFNPHPNMAMAMALSVGFYSNAEYLDVAIDGHISTDDFVLQMNNSLPKGIKIINAKLVEDNFSALTPLVYAADYIISGNDFDLEMISHKIDEMMNKDDIIIKKQTKSNKNRNSNKFTEKNIRPLILELALNNSEIMCKLRCGEINLNPRIIADMILDCDYKIEKTNIYYKSLDDNKLINLDEHIVSI